MDAIIHRSITVKSPMPDGKALYDQYTIIDNYAYRTVSGTMTMHRVNSDAEYLLQFVTKSNIEKGLVAYQFNNTTGVYSFKVLNGQPAYQYITNTNFMSTCRTRQFSSNWYNLLNGYMIPTSVPSELWDTSTFSVSDVDMDNGNVTGYTGTCSYRHAERYLASRTRGSYVNTVLAKDGQYPDNGISGSYWYVKIA